MLSLCVSILKAFFLGSNFLSEHSSSILTRGRILILIFTVKSLWLLPLFFFLSSLITLAITVVCVCMCVQWEIKKKKCRSDRAVVRCFPVPLAYLLCSSALFKNMNSLCLSLFVYLCKCRGGQIVPGLACPWPFVLSPSGLPSRDRPCVWVETLPSTLLAG